MTTAYFDCFNGAGGDMIVASLIDAGADASALRDGLSSLAVSGFEIFIEKVTKQGFAATRFNVHLDESADQPHRHLKHVVEIINQSSLPMAVKEKSIRIFERLATAEAAVHGTTIEKVHFHEVGAIDAIIDVTGAVFALHLLGVDRVMCSAIPVGSGTVTCQHGVMPVPAPATAELLKGIPIAATNETGELTTPTAAAVLTTLAEGFGPLPPMSIQTIGFGAGTRDGQTRPNVLRVMLGDETNQAAIPGTETDLISVLETNLDDTTPEIVGYCMERLLEAGALDAYAMPIQMKKSRPGLILTVLCEAGQVSSLERIIFSETKTLGVRRMEARRTKLSRRLEKVTTPFGLIGMKIATFDDTAQASPEYEDCRAAAMAYNVPIGDVMAAARMAWPSSSPTK